VTLNRPRGVLFDYGGTLVEEAAFDADAGMNTLLAHLQNPLAIPRDAIVEHAELVAREVKARRDEFQIETPWVSITHLTYDRFGLRFTRPIPELELAFWNASVTTHPILAAQETLLALGQLGLRLGVVSNSSFRSHVIRHELAKHGLADPLSVVVASADYAVRKPNPLILEAAAGLLGVPASDIWFVGDRLDTDMAGARAAGLTAVWFAPNGDRSDEVDLTVRSHVELLEHIRSFSQRNK